MKTLLIIPTIVLLYSTYANAKMEARALNPTLVYGTNQGILNDQIMKLKAQEAKGLKINKDRFELCFVEVTDTEKKISTLNIYESNCPKSFDTNNSTSAPLEESFIEKNKTALIQSFELSPSVGTEALTELSKLKANYSSVWDKVLKAGEEEKLNQELSKDSLGKFIFMNLPESPKKKVNIGYIDSDGLIRGLCSEAWVNLCYFIPSEKTFKANGVKNAKSLYRGIVLADNFVAKFRMGTEEVVYENEEDPEAAYSTSNWKLPRKITKFYDLIAAGIFSRGNDDSRDQGYFYFDYEGKQIPITEEWYKFFRSRPELAAKAKRDANAKRSKRVKSEWNYLTAIHPIHLLKVAEKTNKFKLHIGAFVVYSGQIQIDEENCDISETGGFYLLPLEAMKKAETHYPKYAIDELGFSPFMSKLLHGSFSPYELHFGKYDEENEEMKDKMAPGFRKIYPANFLGKKKNDDGKVISLKEIPYVPSYFMTLSKDGGVKRLSQIRKKKNAIRFYSLDLSHDLKEIDETEWVILKGENSQEDMGLYERFKKEGIKDELLLQYLKYFKSNMLKEYVSLKLDSNDQYYFELRGFNPNEAYMNNSKTFTSLIKEKLNFDPEAVYNLWNANLPLVFGKTQIEERDRAQNLIELKKRLARQLYNNEGAASNILYGSTEKVANDFEMGNSVSLKNTDSFINDLSEKKRMVGENRYTSYWRKGSADKIRNIADKFSYDSSANSFIDLASFPKVFYLRTPYDIDGVTPETKLIELSDSERSRLFNLGQIYWINQQQNNSGLLGLIKNNEDQIAKIFLGQAPLNTYFKHLEMTNQLEKLAEKVFSYDNSYFTMRRDLGNLFIHLTKIEKKQKDLFLKEIAKHQSIEKLLGKGLSDLKLENLNQKWNALKNVEEFNAFYTETKKTIELLNQIAAPFMSDEF
jgi:hypothetical protein